MFKTQSKLGILIWKETLSVGTNIFFDEYTVINNSSQIFPKQDLLPSVFTNIITLGFSACLDYLTHFRWADRGIRGTSPENSQAEKLYPPRMWSHGDVYVLKN